MKVSRLFMMSLFCFSLFTLPSCDDGKTDDGDALSKLMPDEHKAKLEEIGLDIAGKVNPESQKDLVKTFDAFIEYAEDFEIEENPVGEYAQGLAASLKKMCEEKSLGEISKISRVTDSELYSLARYAGVYTMTGEYTEWYDTYYVWEKTEYVSDKLEFRFPVESEMAIVQITTEGSDQRFETTADNTDYTIIVPEKAKVTVTCGREELLTLVCDLKVDNVVKSVVSSVTVKANGYTFVENIDVRGDKASTNLCFSIDNKKLVEANAWIEGDNMTDGDVIYDNVDNETIQNLFASGEVVVKVYGNKDGVMLKGYVSNVKELVDKIDRLGDVYWEEENTLAHQTKLAEAYNEFMKGEMYYTSSDNLIARFSMQAYDDSDEWGEYYDIEPVITFVNDDSKFSFESFFDEVSFEDLVDKIEELGDEFDAYID